MKLSAASSSLLAVASAAASSSVDPGALDAAISCNKDLGTLEFVFLEDDAGVRAIEDDIRADLAKVGLAVEARPLNKADLNTARQGGDFHFSIRCVPCLGRRVVCDDDVIHMFTMALPYHPASIL